jgi:Protein of unknown function (DUF559)
VPEAGPVLLPEPLKHRPFTTVEAAAAGIGRGVLAGPSVRRLFVGVYVAADLELDLGIWIRGARLLLGPRAVVDGVTALRLFGVNVGSDFPLRFISTHPHQVRQERLRVTRVSRLPAHDGLSVTPARAFVSAAAVLDLVELVAAGDWLVRLRLIAPAQLVAYAERARGRSVAHARRAASLVRLRVDSPQETRLRLCLLLAGLPEPEPNIVVRAGGGAIGRVDLLFRSLRVVLEYEGDHHRVDRAQWHLDIVRVDALQTAGYTVIRVTAEHLRQPRKLVLRVHQAMLERGYSGPAPVFGTEWTTLFEASAH